MNVGGIQEAKGGGVKQQHGSEDEGIHLGNIDTFQRSKAVSSSRHICAACYLSPNLVVENYFEYMVAEILEWNHATPGQVSILKREN